jgi:adenylate cyclase
VIRVLSASRLLSDSDETSAGDGAIALFKAALHELPQADSLYVGYDDGYWLQVRRLDVLDERERGLLGKR